MNHVEWFSECLKPMEANEFLQAVWEKASHHARHALVHAHPRSRMHAARVPCLRAPLLHFFFVRPTCT